MPVADLVEAEGVVAVLRLPSPALDLRELRVMVACLDGDYTRRRS
jgi:hypothetical protein